MTADSLPYIGPRRRYPRHWFALGYGRQLHDLRLLGGSPAAGALAEKTSRDHALFEFARLRSRR
jgi:glycine/D-amino acid oxidase-like deaminating enzyme